MKITAKDLRDIKVPKFSRADMVRADIVKQIADDLIGMITSVPDKTVMQWEGMEVGVNWDLTFYEHEV